MCVDAEVRIGRIPVEAVKAGAGRGIGVFDAQGVAVASMKNHHGEAMPGDDVWLGIVSGEQAFAGRFAVDG